MRPKEYATTYEAEQQLLAEAPSSCKVSFSLTSHGLLAWWPVLLSLQ